MYNDFVVNTQCEVPHAQKLLDSASALLGESRTVAAQLLKSASLSPHEQEEMKALLRVVVANAVSLTTFTTALQDKGDKGTNKEEEAPQRRMHYDFGLHYGFPVLTLQ